VKTLNKIQYELKAHKSKRNTFGNYNYRSLEDIMEALKPLLKETEAVLTIVDDIQMIGDRVYVKATTTLKTKESSFVASAFAREPLEKKGMDASQITGMASSYARKYALNGLFCIDDTQDADSMDNSEKKQETKTETKITPEQIKELEKGGADMPKLCEYFKVKSANDLTSEQYTKAITMLKARK
jgi:hypothetical protein